jgi:hypothetical protein
MDDILRKLEISTLKAHRTIREHERQSLKERRESPECPPDEKASLQHRIRELDCEIEMIDGQIRQLEHKRDAQLRAAAMVAAFAMNRMWEWQCPGNSLHVH